MKEFWNTIQLVFAAIGGWLGWFLGGCDGLLYALIAFAVIDYTTGVFCAVVDHNLSSEIGAKGIFKKVLIFLLVGIGHIIDTHVIRNGSVIRTAVIFFYLSNEGISIIENSAHLGLPIPEKLKDVLEQLHDRSKKEGDDGTEDSGDHRDPAIIPRHLFMLVQEEMVRRARIETGTGRRSVYSGKYALSSIVYCAHCGDIYQRTQWVLRGEHVPVWRCVSRLLKKKLGTDCPSRTIFEKDLHAAVVKAVNQLIEQKDELLPVFKANVERALGSSNSAAVAEVDEKLLTIQKELLKKADARQGYDDLAEQIEALRDEKQRLLLEDANSANLRQQLKTIEGFLDGQEEAVTEYDEMLVRKLIDKVTVYDDKLVVEFKSGFETEVKI